MDEFSTSICGGCLQGAEIQMLKCRSCGMETFGEAEIQRNRAARLADFHIAGWRAVWRGDSYIWHSSRIVPTKKDAESIVTQWEKQWPSSSFTYEVEALAAMSPSAAAALSPQPAPEEPRQG